MTESSALESEKKKKKVKVVDVVVLISLFQEVTKSLDLLPNLQMFQSPRGYHLKAENTGKAHRAKHAGF